ncbi:hypothetical protein LLG95_17785, partial [bacterium]|nr:hypothetical protein [bacterium]
LLAEEMIARFHDSMRDGFFATDGRDPTVIARIKEFHDGSMPSGNAAAAMALMRLGVHMRCEDWLELARRTINAAGPRLAEYPLGHVGLLAAVAFDIAPPCEIAIAGDLEDPATRDLIDAAWKRYVPARVLAAGPEGSVELLVGRKPVQGRPTAHVCRAQTCGEPAHTRKELLNQL